MSLRQFAVTSPYRYGMNLLQGIDDERMEFARELNNMVFDDNGALSLAPPWRARDHTFDTVNELTFIYTFKGSSGIVAVMATDGEGASTELDADANPPLYFANDWFDSLSFGSNSAVGTAGIWKGVTFNGQGYLFQEGSPAKVVTAGGNISDLGGSPPQAGVAHFAFGHIFVGDGATLQWCDFRDPTNWSSGSAGSSDLTTLGVDEIVAIADMNNRLVVFGTNKILFFDFGIIDLGDLAPAFTAATLVDTIEGMGCVAQGSVVSTGQDLIFLAPEGVRSVGRLTQSDGVLPVGQVSTLVDTGIAADVLTQGAVGANRIQAVWWPEKRWYMLSFPTASRVWVFDFSLRTPLGTPRATALSSEVRHWVSYSFNGRRHVGAIVYDPIDGFNLCAFGNSADGGSVFPDRGRNSGDVISLPVSLGVPDKHKVVKEVELAGYGEESASFGGSVRFYGVDESPASWATAYSLRQNANNALDADLRWYSVAPAAGSGTEFQIKTVFNGGTQTGTYSLTRFNVKFKLGRSDSGRY